VEEELEVRKGTLAFPEDELRHSLHRSIEEWYSQLRACLVHADWALADRTDEVVAIMAPPLMDVARDVWEEINGSR
jgi:hypothetical protein